MSRPNPRQPGTPTAPTEAPWIGIHNSTDREEVALARLRFLSECLCWAGEVDAVPDPWVLSELLDECAHVLDDERAGRAARDEQQLLARMQAQAVTRG